MLSPGSTIGSYRVDREIGRGGMGVIFLAQDTRLGRAAAIKALPEEVAADPERLARFEREAKTLASLAHPNVAGIYGLEESEGRRYLALEYVEGESLAERLTRGPLSVADTIEIGLQIAAGIEAAHEGGIIHRDLKPGNVVITAADQAKVLDFGLAKGRVVEWVSGASPTSPTADSPVLAQSPTLLNSPTVQTPATMPGVILGTAAYLSPEQARGKAVDRRTDIWSFGCLLYECLTGRQAFEGETVSDTLAKILERDVELDALPPAAPAALRALLARCLEKDPRRRLRDIGDARLTLEELKAGHSSAALAAVGAAGVAATGSAGADPAAAVKAAVAAGVRQRNRFAAAAFLVGVVLTVGAWIALGRGGWGSSGIPGGIARVSISIPDHIRAQAFRLTPDGTTAIVRAVPKNQPPGEESISMLYVRRIDSDAFEPLRGTERVTDFLLYPDGKRIGFLKLASERSTEVKQMVIPVDGSAPAAEVRTWDDTWSGSPALLESGEQLVVVRPGDMYVRIPAGGGPSGAPREFALPDVEGDVAFVDVLPGDRGVLLRTTSYEGGAYVQGVAVLDLKTGASKALVGEGGSPHYSSTGHLLFSRQSTLFAVPFDLGRLEIKGQPAAIFDGLRIGAAWMNGSFDLTETGTLYFEPGGFVGKDRRLVVVDPEGRASEWTGERLPFERGVWLSPDGTRAASVVASAAGLYEIWVSERSNKTARRLVAREGSDCGVGVWSPDGTKIAYQQIAQSEEDGIYVIDADGTGTPRRIATGSKAVTLFPASWSTDGSLLLATRFEAGRADIVSISLLSSGGGIPEPVSFLSPGGRHRLYPRLSPDNRLLAYASDEAGPRQIHICQWGGSAPVGQTIGLGAGNVGDPMWSHDGKRIYFASPAGKLMVTEVSLEPRLSATPPRALWDWSELHLTSDNMMSLLPGGHVVAIREGDAEGDVTRSELVLGFPELLKTRLRQARGG